MTDTKLQTPKYALKNGELLPWNDAVLHIGSEAVNRGLSVFEGIKGYWRVDGEFGLLALRKHYDRLCRSARLLHIPFETSFDEFEAQVLTLTHALLQPGADLWLRATLFVVEGHWGENTRADFFMTAYQCSQELSSPVSLGISTWQRSSDNSVSYRIKSASNYQVGRLARIEGRTSGYDDMILLNQWGRVAEATGAAILLVRDGRVLTPDHSEGALESITVDIVEALACSLNVPFERRPIDRTELHIAQEIGLCGTLAELISGHSFCTVPLNQDVTTLKTLHDAFFDIVRGRRDLPQVEITSLRP